MALACEPSLEAERIRKGEVQPYHAILSDFPYGLEFMGKEWDAPHKATSFPKPGNIGGFADGNKPSFTRQGDIGERLEIAFKTWGEAMLPLLHPGALVLIFAGTRTYCWLGTAMQKAGFDMWDTITFLKGGQEEVRVDGPLLWIPRPGLPLT